MYDSLFNLLSICSLLTIIGGILLFISQYEKEDEKLTKKGDDMVIAGSILLGVGFIGGSYSILKDKY